MFVPRKGKPVSGGGSQSRGRSGAGVMDLSDAILVSPATTSGPAKKAVDVFVEEVRKRTGIRLEVAGERPRGRPFIAVGSGKGIREVLGKEAATLDWELL